MNTDEKIKFAERLAAELTGVDRNEWKKWTEYLADVKDFDKALRLATALHQKLMLREGPQRSYRTIETVIRRHLSQLKQYPLADALEIFGYANRLLVWKLTVPMEGIIPRLRQEQRRFGNGGKGSR